MAHSQYWLQALGMLLALSGWAKVGYDYLSSRPKIRGRVFQVMRAQMTHPDKPDHLLATLIVYLYLINTRKNSIHVLDYELDVESEGVWKRVDRVYGFHNVQEISFSASTGEEVKIVNFKDNLIYRKGAPVEFGKPLHGWIVFTTDAPFDQPITRYRVTCIDAYRKRHRFETTPENLASLPLLDDLAGVEIPRSAIRLPQPPKSR